MTNKIYQKLVALKANYSAYSISYDEIGHEAVIRNNDNYLFISSVVIKAVSSFCSRNRASFYINESGLHVY